MASHYIVGVFQDATSFKEALASLVDDGFPLRAISILTDQQTLHDQIGDSGPPVEDDQDDHDIVKTAIHLFAEGLATIGMIGAAGIAYAVGGPIGVAATAGDSTELTIENFLADHVDETHRESYQQTVQIGGVVCWVRVESDAEEDRARRVLSAQNADDIHTVTKGEPSQD